jgi:hypothetical protein
MKSNRSIGMILVAIYLIIYGLMGFAFILARPFSSSILSRWRRVVFILIGK